MQYRSFIGGSLSPSVLTESKQSEGLNLVLVRGEASESVPQGKTCTASERRQFIFTVRYY